MKVPGAAGGGGKLSMFKDKRVLYGIGGVAVLGVIVLLKNGGGAAAGTGSADGGQAITPADYNSTGVDSYNAIAQIGQAWGDQFQAYTDQLGQIADQLGKVNGPSGSTVPPPKPVTPPAKKPPTKVPSKKPAPKAPGKVYDTVSAWKKTNTPYDSSLSGLAKHYHTSVSKIYKLNPQLHGKSLIHPGQKIRVK